MGEVFGFLALPFGGLAGMIGAMSVIAFRLRAKRLQHIKTRLSGQSYLSAHGIQPESSGYACQVLQRLVHLSEKEVDLSRFSWLLFEPIGKSRIEALITTAGLEGLVTHKGVCVCRLLYLVVGLLLGCLLGSLFSEILALLCGVVGALVGFALPTRVLKTETDLRKQSIEHQLSQMMEVVVLGLQSGLSFDRALALYTVYFSGSLSRSFARVLNQWQHGLVERSTALRNLAATYDSSLFSRVVESIIRSLRFGSSLSESLSLLAQEARAVRKASLEERVAKAPVKMLLPVGTLILPAMLILIMGPILLDLMGGK